MNRAVNTYFSFSLNKLLLISVAIILMGSMFNIAVICFNIGFDMSIYFYIDFSPFSFRVYISPAVSAGKGHYVLRKLIVETSLFYSSPNFILHIILLIPCKYYLFMKNSKE
jgi:hypothetical protein